MPTEVVRYKVQVFEKRQTESSKQYSSTDSAACEFDAYANFGYNINSISYKLAKTICMTS